MRVTSLELTDFRNYENLRVAIEPGITVFFGDNAEGKTNLLEAVYLCACARSHRTSRDSDLIHHDRSGYRVGICFLNRHGQEETLALSYREQAPESAGGRAFRTIEHNGAVLQRVADLMGLFHAVIFAPEDLMLVKEGPSARRRYMDLLISQVRPSYFHDLQQYARQLSQRNALLKQLRSEGRTGEEANVRDSLEVWDEALVHTGSRILAVRQHFAERIREIAADRHAKLSSGRERLHLRYRALGGGRQGQELLSATDWQEPFRTRLVHGRKEDIEKGATGVGPHRDDLELSLDGEGMKPFSSQGQQRSAVLSLRLAELVILHEETGDMPVLLLDDVMSELDAGRRARLLEDMGEAQVLVTCTDAAHIVDQMGRLLKSEGVTYHQVSEGRVDRVDPVG